MIILVVVKIVVKIMQYVLQIKTRVFHKAFFRSYSIYNRIELKIKDLGNPVVISFSHTKYSFELCKKKTPYGYETNKKKSQKNV